MDCEKLNQNITKLKSLQSDIISQLDYAKTEGLGKIQLNKSIKESSELTDRILESYLDDFYEHNKDLLEINLGTRIEGFENSYGFPAVISSINELQDGSIMIGSSGGALYHATIDKKGNINLGTRIEGFEGSDGYPVNIYSITELQDGSIMIGGYGGALYRATIPQRSLEHLKQNLDKVIQSQNAE